jgi:hypothetical protein
VRNSLVEDSGLLVRKAEVEEAATVEATAAVANRGAMAEATATTGDNRFLRFFFPQESPVVTRIATGPFFCGAYSLRAGPLDMGTRLLRM